jgi:hypothetical protein
VKLPGLLHELELSAQPTQALSVRIEVDTRPPAVVRRHELLQLIPILKPRQLLESLQYG